MTSLELGPLHAFLLRTIVERGFAPRVEEMAVAWSVSEEWVRARLRALAEQHGVVLHPRSDEVWVVHPFSTSPALFAVWAGREVWWASCAWCAMGVAALIGRDCRLTSTLGGHGERVDLEVREGEITPDDLLIHFPVPMARAWDNVVHTCSTMLLFTDEAEIDRWCARHGFERGDVRRVGDFWPFAREWYGGHLSEAWTKVSLGRARELFERHGLDGPIWSLDEGGERF